MRVSSKIDSLMEHLQELAAHFVERFPRHFDERLIWNAKFLESNPYLASKRTSAILLTLYFLQKKMELALEERKFQKPLFLKLIRQSHRLCVVLAFKEGLFQQKESFKKILAEFLPGFQVIGKSFHSWSHPTLPYLIWIVELSRLRGKDFALLELKKKESLLLQQLRSASCLTHCFWPYNKEDAFRSIQILEKEMNHQNDLPHLFIQFLEQTDSCVEFLLCLALPKRSVSLAELIYRLPYPICVCCHFLHEREHPFLREIGAFSIQMPSALHSSSTLLRARRYILQNLETVIGTFRDCNGGLLEKQQQQFEEIHFCLANRCANFDLFAERLFYALHFHDAWLVLPIEKMADLFTAFSKLLDDPQECSIHQSEKDHFTLVKSKGDWAHQKRLQQIEREHKLELCAQLSIEGTHYRCYFGTCKKQIEESFCHPVFPKRERTLRLNFQEGPPPSLNPHYSNVDIRCCVLHRLIFEGLTRIDPTGEPSLAAAQDVSISSDGCCYTFTLRPSRWSNGEKVRADHFVNSLQCGVGNQVPHPERLFLIKNARNEGAELGVRALNAETLQIELERPDPQFLYKLAQPSFFPLFGGDREPKWFNGPFLIHDFTEQELILEKNPYFWDAQNIYFERIEITWVSDVEEIFQLYADGMLDWIGEPFNILSIDQIDRLLQKQNLIKKIVQRQCRVYFNTTHSILKSSKARRALAQVVDNERITQNVCFHCEPLKLKRHPELAKSWLEEGLSELGLTTAPPLQLMISNHPRRKDLGLYLQSVWQELGIEVEILELGWNHFRNHLEKRDFQIAITLQDTIESESLEYYSKMEGDSSWNFSQWQHLSYRKIVKSPESNWKKLAEEILEVEAPLISLFQYAHLMAIRPQLRNYYLDPEGCVDLSRANLIDIIPVKAYHRLPK